MQIDNFKVQFLMVNYLNFITFSQKKALEHVVMNKQFIISIKLLKVQHLRNDRQVLWIIMS